ncbi:hypothetical protein ACXX9E_28570 [Pseudomonas sp. GNP014]
MNAKRSTALRLLLEMLPPLSQTNSYSDGTLVESVSTAPARKSRWRSPQRHQRGDAGQHR